MANLVTFGLFPEKFRVFNFSVFGFVYLLTFPGKIQSSQFSLSSSEVNLFIFLNIRGKFIVFRFHFLDVHSFQ